MSNAALAADRFASAGSAFRYASRPINEREPEHERGDGDPDPPAHQRLAAVAGEPDAGRGEHDREDRQDDRELVEQPHAGLRVLQALGVEELELQRQLADRQLVEDPDAPFRELRSQLHHERGEVEHDLAVLRLDDLATSGERLHHLLVRVAVRFVPELLELLGLEELQRHAFGEFAQRGRERPGEERGLRGKHVFGGRLDVDVVEQRVRDPHRECACAISSLRASGATVATYSSVSSTWLCAHTATTDNGTRMQLRTISTIERMRRQRGCLPRFGAVGSDGAGSAGGAVVVTRHSDPATASRVLTPSG